MTTGGREGGGLVEPSGLPGVGGSVTTGGSALVTGGGGGCSSDRWRRTWLLILAVVAAARTQELAERGVGREVGLQLRSPTAAQSATICSSSGGGRSATGYLPAQTTYGVTLVALAASAK